MGCCLALLRISGLSILEIEQGAREGMILLITQVFDGFVGFKTGLIRGCTKGV